MSLGAYYEHKAEQSERLAAAATDPSKRASLLEVGKLWCERARDIAKRIVRRADCPSWRPCDRVGPIVPDIPVNIANLRICSGWWRLRQNTVTEAFDVRFARRSGHHPSAHAMSAIDPGCVKTLFTRPRPEADIRHGLSGDKLRR
jgi:hypothetical protein